MSSRGINRFEISTSGPNVYAQGVGTDPFGGNSSLGIAIPTIQPTTNDFNHRYLFCLAYAQFNAHRKVRLVGARQYLSLIAQMTSGSGDSACTTPIYKEVESPGWSYPDGNVSWYISRVAPMTLQTASPKNKAAQSFLYAQGPSLLVVNQASDIGGYLPPNGGAPWGEALMPDLWNFKDLRFPWRTDQAWGALNIEFEGPCDVVMFASVQQTNPSFRCPLVLAAPPFTDLGAFGPEDRFVSQTDQFATIKSVYGRIAGSLIFEEENFTGDAAPMTEKPLPQGITP